MYTSPPLPRHCRAGCPRSCDFCLGSYNFDPVVNDTSMSHFDFGVTHDTKTMLPLMHKAIAKSARKINIFATPWSPPPWMKVSPQRGRGTTVP